MPGRFLEIPVFLGDCFIMPHPVHTTQVDDVDDNILHDYIDCIWKLPLKHVHVNRALWGNVIKLTLG